MKSWAKKVKRLTKVLLCGIVATTIIPISVNAVVPCGTSGDGYRCHTNSTDGGYHHTYGDKIMNYGVGDYGNHRRYYWTSGLDSTTEKLAASAVSNWVNTSGSGGPGVYTPISIRKTSTKSDAVFEIVKNENLGQSTLAVTRFYMYNREIKVNSNGVLPENYGWSQVQLHLSLMDDYTQNEREATIAHELGHAMGLSHQNCRTSSVMCSFAYGGTAKRADKKDLRAINHLYA